MLIRIMICIIMIGITWWRSEMGLAASIQAFLIKSAFDPPDYSYGPKAVVENNDMISVFIPLIVFIIILFKTVKKKETFTLRFTDVAFIALGGVLLLGSMYSPLQTKAIMVTAKYYSLGISFYFIARLCFSKHKEVRKALSNLLLMTWLLALTLGLFAFIQSWGMEYARLKLGAAVPIPFSLLLAIGVLVNFGWFLFTKVGVGLRLLQIISFVTLLYIFIDTNTRGTIIAVSIAILFLSFVYVINHREWLKVLLFIPIIILGVILTSKINPNLVERVSSNLQLITSSDQGESIDNRQFAYSDAWNLLNEHPYFGAGTGDFEEHSLLAYPHNTVLEILSENGIFGFAFLLAVYISVSFYIVKICRYREPIAYIIAAIVLLNLIEMQFSFTLWMHKSFYLFSGVLVSTYYYLKYQSAIVYKVPSEKMRLSRGFNRLPYKVFYPW